jgi:hypothetical protein
MGWDPALRFGQELSPLSGTSRPPFLLTFPLKMKYLSPQIAFVFWNLCRFGQSF